MADFHSSRVKGAILAASALSEGIFSYLHKVARPTQNAKIKASK